MAVNAIFELHLYLHAGSSHSLKSVQLVFYIKLAIIQCSDPIPKKVSPLERVRLLRVSWRGWVIQHCILIELHSADEPQNDTPALRRVHRELKYLAIGIRNMILLLCLMVCKIPVSPLQPCEATYHCGNQTDCRSYMVRVIPGLLRASSSSKCMIGLGAVN